MFPGEVMSIYFPSNLETTFLYPQTSSVYTHADGTTHDVTCFVPKAAEIPKVECPHPFGKSLASQSPRENVFFVHISRQRFAAPPT
jgi:hypothetical protein